MNAHILFKEKDFENVQIYLLHNGYEWILSDFEILKFDHIMIEDCMYNNHYYFTLYDNFNKEYKNTNNKIITVDSMNEIFEKLPIVYFTNIIRKDKMKLI